MQSASFMISISSIAKLLYLHCYIRIMRKCNPNNQYKSKTKVLHEVSSNCSRNRRKNAKSPRQLSKRFENDSPFVCFWFWNVKSYKKIRLRHVKLHKRKPVSSIYIWSENFRSRSEAKNGGHELRRFQYPYAVFHVYV